MLIATFKAIMVLIPSGVGVALGHSVQLQPAAVRWVLIPSGVGVALGPTGVVMGEECFRLNPLRCRGSSRTYESDYIVSSAKS